MEFVLLITAPFLGYYLNRNGKQNREIKDSVVMFNDGRPQRGSGNRSREVRDHLQRLASERHPSKIRSMFGSAADAPNEGTFFADDQSMSFAEAPASSGFDDSAASRFERQLGSLKGSPELLAYDPSSGSAMPPALSPVQNTASFRSWPTKGPESAPLSPLTGLPLDMTHNNMQPFFGKHSFAGPTPQARDTLLEHFTGRSADLPPKREQLNNATLTRNKFPDPGLSAAQSKGLDRAMSTIRPSNDYIKPFKGFRDSPDVRSDTRVLPLDIDALRGPGKEKQVYTGGVTLGQLGSTRPMQPALSDNRYLLDLQNHDMLPTQSAFTMASNNAIPEANREKPTYTNDYMGVPTFPMKTTDVSSISHGLQNTQDATVARRQETWTPALSAPTGRRAGMKAGTITARDPEKGHPGAVPAAPHQSINNRLRNVSAPDTTVRELTQSNPHSGTMNASAGTRTDGSYKIVNHEVPVTNKALNSDGTYIGPATGDKLQPMKQNFDLTETFKDMNSFSVTGNPDVYLRLPPVAPRVDLAGTFKSMNLTEQHGNPTGRTKGAPQKGQFDNDPTMKETVLHSVAGNPQSRVKSGAMIGTHEKDSATDREMNSSEYSGAPRAAVPSHMSYEAVFDLSDSTLETDYVSIPRNPAWRHTKGPGEITSGTKEALTAERFGNPESREKRHERTSIQETRLPGREEIPGQMGNPYHPSASMAGHDAEVSLKDGLVVEGRFENPLSRDPGGIGRMSFSFDLKEESRGSCSAGQVRTLPRALKSPEPGVSVRSVNTEALNPRFDPSTRVPRLASDLFPVVS